MKNKTKKNMILYLFIAFLLPLLSIAIQLVIENTFIKFILYGIEAAAPSIAAIIVLCINKSFKRFFIENFSSRNLLSAFLLPFFIAFITMSIAKLCTSFVSENTMMFGHITFVQFIIISWSFLAEELGWRGYLQPLLTKNVKKEWTIPFIVGVIWCLWHYHYFLMDGIQVPFILFLVSCIIESYIYSYLLAFTKNNLISAMTYHLIWNLFLHVFAINPIDNNGSLFPYTI